MSKPIQDRIFRSRLTIKYRTNIDGVPVPQTLPLRLLVLGDFTGRKRTGENKPEGLHVLETRPLSERRVYSIKRGFRVDDLMKELDISFPIPTPDKELSPFARLSESAKVAGVFTAEGAGRLSTTIEEIDDSGACSIKGQVNFEAALYDNVDMKLVGPLDAVLKVRFGTLAVGAASTPVSLSGELAIPVTGTGPNGAPLTLTPADLRATPGRADTFQVDVTGAVEIRRAGPSTAWFTDGQATGTLEGKVRSGQLFASGTLTVKDQNQTEHPLTVTDAVIALDPGPKLPASPTATLTAAGRIGVVVEASVTLGDLLPGAEAKSLPIKRSGEIRSPITAHAVSLTNASGSPTFTATANLTGEISSDLKGLMGKGSDTSVSFPFGPVGASALPAAGPERTLDFSLNVALNDAPSVTGKVIGRVSAKLSPKLSVDWILGRARGKTSTDFLPGSGALDVNDIVADVACGDGHVRGLQGSVVLYQDKGDTRVAVELAGGCDARRTIPIRSLDSFSPDAIARMIPEIRRLRIVQNLLQELKSDINLIPGVRKAVAELLAKASQEHKLVALKQVLRARYPALVIERTAAEAATVAKSDVVWFEGFFVPQVRGLINAAEIQDVPKAPAESPEPLEARHALVMLQKKDESGLSGYEFHDYDTSDNRVRDSDRLLNGLAVLIINHDDLGTAKPGQLGDKIDELIERVQPEGSIADGRPATIKQLMHDYVGFVLDNPDFRSLERNWRDLIGLCSKVETDEVIIDVLDVGEDEVVDDMTDHRNDIFTSALFKKIYIDEYDRYGGRPFAAMIGLYHVRNYEGDIEVLETLAQVANAAHCPFITGVAPEFFGSDIKSWSDLEAIDDIDAHLALPKFGKWNRLRNRDEAAYVGLTLPGYLVRQPWGAEENQLGNRELKYSEVKNGFREHYLWGNSAVLFAGNMVHSFEGSGWCQYIRGVKGGGLVQGLTVHTLKRHGKEEPQPPVEVEIADYRELQFAKAGLIPLVHCKGTADATFFSSQSIKRPHDFRSEIDTQNAYLVTNLAYTLSITRIAHYVKRMMRDYIGSTADAGYIQNVLQLWLDDYITTTVNPDDLTLRYYPFKAVSVAVEPKPGPLGWYKAVISILPHVQFEGMDVELRLEAALGGK